MSRRTWRWKATSARPTSAQKLLYEPGNWGDVLKGSWALRVLEALGPRPVRILDPFAGAATYALSDAAARRIHSLGAAPFARAQAPFVSSGLLASTGRLLIAAAWEGSTADVFDVDRERLATWKSVVGANVIAAADGETLLAVGSESAWDLVLIDPYDLVERSQRLAAAATLLARATPVLLYAYSKAPRGGGHERSYRTYRLRLDEALRREPALMSLTGRIPSDERMPRAYHEVVLIGRRAVLEDLEEPLRRITEELARDLAARGAFEAT